MKLAILRNSDVMEKKKRIPDSDSANQNCTETNGFVSGQKVELILLTCVILEKNEAIQSVSEDSEKTKITKNFVF